MASTLWLACAGADGPVDVGADYKIELPKGLESGLALEGARDDSGRIIARDPATTLGFRMSRLDHLENLLVRSGCVPEGSGDQRVHRGHRIALRPRFCLVQRGVPRFDFPHARLIVGCPGSARPGVRRSPVHRT